MHKPEIIPRKFYRSTENPKLTASVYGGIPHWPHELVENGFTIRWPDGTVGHPSLPFGATREQAEALVTKLAGFKGCHQY